jgi:two-component system sensor histidine kinase KdpD
MPRDSLRAARGLWSAQTWRPYLTASGVITVCSLLAWGTSSLGLSEPNVVMIFLAGVALVAARSGHGPAIAAALLAVLVFDYFFVHPIFGFYPSDAQYFVTLSVMLGIGLLISELMARLQSQLRTSRDQEQRTAELFYESQQRERRTTQVYELSRQLSRMSGPEFLIATSARHLAESFHAEVALFLREPDGTLSLRSGQGTTLAGHESLAEATQWVLAHDQSAGIGTDRFAETGAVLAPMIGAQQTRGVLAVRPSDLRRLDDPEERRMLETCANLIALSIDRDQSVLDAQQALVQVQSEQLRNALLSAVSHELRTPLATIAVTAAGLIDGSLESQGHERREMLETLVDESHRMARQVDNLLDMARLDGGAIALDRDWEVLEELVGVAISRLKRQLDGRTVKVSIPADFPLLWIADDLVEQVLINLLENAIRYTPPGKPIEVTATAADNSAIVRIADFGPGLPPGYETKVFDKFFRGRTPVADGRRGIGLGLAICRGIVQAHGGTILAANRPGGGAQFTITLPLGGPNRPGEHQPAALDAAAGMGDS